MHASEYIGSLHACFSLFVLWSTRCFPFSWIIMKPNSNATQQLVYGRHACVAWHEVQVSIRFGINITGHVCYHTSFFFFYCVSTVILAILVKSWMVLDVKWIWTIKPNCFIILKNVLTRARAVIGGIHSFLGRGSNWETLHQRSLRQFHRESCAKTRYVSCNHFPTAVSDRFVMMCLPLWNDNIYSNGAISLINNDRIRVNDRIGLL